MERYIIDIEYSIQPDEHPVSVYLRKVNIDPKGYTVAEFHGKTLNKQLRAAEQRILEEETVTVTID